MVELGKPDFQKLVNTDNNELRIAFKIRGEHLHCKGSKRQRVCLATQLLSHTVAKAYAYLFRNKDENADVKHDCIKLFNDYFDVMNSNTPFAKIKLRCGFGVHHDEQMRVLSQMETFLDTFQVKTKDAPQPWQHGVRCSIKATRALFSDLIENKEFNPNGDLKFIMTHKVCV